MGEAGEGASDDDVAREPPVPGEQAESQRECEKESPCAAGGCKRACKRPPLRRHCLPALSTGRVYRVARLDPVTLGPHSSGHCGKTLPRDLSCSHCPLPKPRHCVVAGPETVVSCAAVTSRWASPRSFTSAMQQLFGAERGCASRASRDGGKWVPSRPSTPAYDVPRKSVAVSPTRLGAGGTL